MLNPDNKPCRVLEAAYAKAYFVPAFSPIDTMVTTLIAPDEAQLQRLADIEEYACEDCPGPTTGTEQAKRLHLFPPAIKTEPVIVWNCTRGELPSTR